MASLKSFKQDPAKALWRERIVDFVRQHYTPNQIRNFRVLCFAGKEMAEVFDVYDELGVKRKNVVSLEYDRSEFEAESALNDSLEQRIKVVPASALDYLSQRTVEPFDLISLDYCGYFNEEKYQTLCSLARRTWLSPKAVLITNYQSGRENARTQQGFRATGLYMKSHDDLVSSDFSAYADFVVANKGLVDDETKLEELRDHTIQCTAVAEMAYGSGFWNTPFFKVWLESQPEETKKAIAETVDSLNLSQNTDQRELLSRFMVEGQRNNRDLLLIYFLKSQTTTFECSDHQSYKYVSDSGTPLISDFYLFEQELIKLPPEVKKSVSYERTPEGYLFRIKDRRKVELLYQGVENIVREMNRRALMEGDYSFIKQRINLVLDGQHLNPDTRSMTQVVPPYLCSEIYTALSRKTPDSEIMTTYSLSKMQLAGYKATYTRLQNQDPTTSSAPRSSKNSTSTFAPDDLEIITGLVGEGYKATAIVELFKTEDGTAKYSWQSIAAYKASLTKSDGTLSNERLFAQMKPEILERDSHTCQWCNKTADQQQEQSGHRFHVHHINYNHDDTRPDNLVTLCTPCHARTNTIQNGAEMREYFGLLMTERYSTATSA